NGVGAVVRGNDGSRDCDLLTLPEAVSQPVAGVATEPISANDPVLELYVSAAGLGRYRHDIRVQQAIDPTIVGLENAPPAIEDHVTRVGVRPGGVRVLVDSRGPPRRCVVPAKYVRGLVTADVQIAPRVCGERQEEFAMAPTVDLRLAVRDELGDLSGDGDRAACLLRRRLELASQYQCGRSHAGDLVRAIVSSRPDDLDR